MKKRALFFDCFYSFTPLLSPLSLSRLHILSSKANKLAKAKAKGSNKIYIEDAAFNGQLCAFYFIQSKDQFNSALRYAALGG